MIMVNRYWQWQQDADTDQLPPIVARTERDWIRVHLSLVENKLRSRSVANLSAAQKQKRNLCLDYLNGYWHSGAFPVNDDYSYRTPIFIDKQDNFCAVGYLIKATGYESLAREISATNNLAYIMDLKFAALNSWASEFGFTREELAWIQPTYPPEEYAAAVGNGVNGRVNELLVDKTGEKLFVGGEFDKVNGTAITAGHVAYVTEADGEYTWHTLGSGVNGPVYAMAEYDDVLFVAGNFDSAGGEMVNNIAIWTGSEWNHAGCLYGTVYDLIVFKGELYAAGEFDACASLNDVNFARWNGTLWVQIPGLSGHINTMKAMGEDLLLGGNFLYNQKSENVIKWNPDDHFRPFGNSVSNEVRDFEIFNDTVYAACKWTNAQDSGSLLQRLSDDSWEPLFSSTFAYLGSVNNTRSFNTLIPDPPNLMIGGAFTYTGLMYMGTNTISLSSERLSSGKWFEVDNEVNKMVWFKDELYAGGNFKYSLSFSGNPAILLNGLAKRMKKTTHIKDRPQYRTFNIYPNPATSFSALTIENDFEASLLLISDVSGRQVTQIPLINRAKQQVMIPDLRSGLYLAEVLNNMGYKVVKKIIVR